MGNRQILWVELVDAAAKKYHLGLVIVTIRLQEADLPYLPEPPWALLNLSGIEDSGVLIHPSLAAASLHRCCPCSHFKKRLRSGKSELYEP